MGKNYDAYARAVQANNQAKMQIQVVNGGSTEQAMNEALTNQEQNQRIEDEAWDRLMDDPTG